MTSTFCSRALAFITLCNISTGVALAQDYPNKPIRIVTAAAGGIADFAARITAQALAGNLGQQVIVDNRDALIGIEAVAKAPPDGYTLLFIGPPLWITPLTQSTSYDPVRDFSSITLAVSAPNILVVHPSLPVKSVNELINFAKARPGELNYSSGATGSSNHLMAELFKAMTGVNVVRIPYKGEGPALNGLIAGHVQLMFANAAAAIPHVKSGRLRALAFTSAKPSALMPGLPTVAASGVHGYEAESIQGVFAPAKTPLPIISRLNQEIVRGLNRPEVKERFLNSGVETVGSSPEQLSATIKSEIGRMGKIIKDAGIKTD